MADILTFKPKVDEDELKNPVRQIQKFLSQQGIFLNDESFDQISKIIGPQENAEQVTDLLSLYIVCNTYDFCIVFNGGTERVHAFIPGAK